MFCCPGGIEDSCFVQLIQYLIFVVKEETILKHIKNLACLLRAKFKQNGVTIITPNETFTYYDGEWTENIREE